MCSKNINVFSDMKWCKVQQKIGHIVRPARRTHMSNELRGSRISPLRLETESEEHKSFGVEVSMLIRLSRSENVNLGR